MAQSTKTTTVAETTVKPAATDYKAPTGASMELTYAAKGQGSFSYIARADWITLRNKKEKPSAEMFHVAYTKIGKNPPANRPITFVFNGGPGAAAAYLHLGSLGPKRVSFGMSGEILPPPAQLVDNAESWLPFTDLVFIDPVGTGFSRTIEDTAKPADGSGKEPAENNEYFAVHKDIDSFGEFIRRFLSAHGRWSSPVYIAGESYGGFRVGKLARHLQEKFGVGLSAAILISPALQFSLLNGSDYDSLMWSDVFPTLAASAAHHGRSKVGSGKASVEKAMAEAEAFAGDELTRLLVLGEGIEDKERAAIVKKQAAMLGLSEKFVEKCGGRVSITAFARELLRDEDRHCGLYDGSITSIDPFPDRMNFEGPDHTLAALDKVFSGGANALLREVIGLKTDREYHLLSMDVNTAWKIDDAKRHALETETGATDDLRYGMALNPSMQVAIVHGIFDMVTPYYSSKRIAGLMKLKPEQKKNLSLLTYKGGHMFYTWQESRVKFRDQMAKLYN